MTRYARCGSTRRHQKMPSDATPWEQWNNPVNDTNKEGAKQSKKAIRKQKSKLLKKSKLKTLKQDSTLKESPLEKQTESPVIVSGEEDITPETHDITECLGKNDLQNDEAKEDPISPKSRSMHSTEISRERNSPEISNEKNNTEEESSPETLKERKNLEPSIEQNNLDTFEKKSKSKTFSNNKPGTNRERREKYPDKLRMKFSEKGLLLLPLKMEQKIFRIKKALRKKNLPPESIKDIIRKERRSAELQMRKLSKCQTCFNCRQVGHVFADCPTASQHGICFKCGSTEHTSSKCFKNISGYPFAKCFICNEVGHLSKDCPKNEHGVYIRGGQCHLCGNVNHFKKDCPTLKKEEPEKTVVAYTINEGVSVDQEIIPKVQEEKPPKPKKAKIVKF